MIWELIEVNSKNSPELRQELYRHYEELGHRDIEATFPDTKIDPEQIKDIVRDLEWNHKDYYRQKRIDVNLVSDSTDKATEENLKYEADHLRRQVAELESQLKIRNHGISKIIELFQDSRSKFKYSDSSLNIIDKNNQENCGESVGKAVSAVDTLVQMLREVTMEREEERKKVQELIRELDEKKERLVTVLQTLEDVQGSFDKEQAIVEGADPNRTPKVSVFSCLDIKHLQIL